MIKNIFCIGGANIDYKLKSKNIIALQTSNPVTSCYTFGGVARNVAQNLAQMTSKIHLQCVVGDDAEGRALLQHLHELGVDIQNCLILEGKTTSRYYAILNNEGELYLALADMDIYQDMTVRFNTSEWDLWEEQSLIFLDTNLPAPLIDLAIKKANERGAVVCIDPVSVEKTKKIPYRLDSVYLIKPDLLEASALTNMHINSIADCMIAARKLKARGAHNVVISMGHLGYVLVNETHELHVVAEEVRNVIDVSGAGDAFVAGILCGLQQGKNVFESCQQGARAAASTIQSVETVVHVSNRHSAHSSFYLKDT